MAEKNQPLKISKKGSEKGNANHKVFSIRVSNDLAEKLNKLSKQTLRSRNELIATLLEYAIENCEIE
ncbi:MAG: CopG family transcriptional regulator [Ruminococcus sp.]|nr:CopG family transcriptional regulator [Ruminococcus sp.]